MRNLNRIALGFCTLALVGCDERRAAPTGSLEPWELGGEDPSEDREDPPTEDSDDDPIDEEPHDVNPWETPPDCSGDTITVQVDTPNVMLVLDKSGSMSLNSWRPAGTGDEETRWSSLHGVVTDLVDAFDSRVNFGAALFPADGIDGEVFEAACSVADEAEVPVGPANGAAILAAIPGAEARTRGGTPAAAGVFNALDALGEAPENEPAAMILVTDGIANCSGPDDIRGYDENLAHAVKDAFEHDGIPTYVVGIDIQDRVDDTSGVNPREKLHEVALYGGAARSGEEAFYNVADGAELAATMGSIAAELACTVTLPIAPHEPDFMRVRLGGSILPRVDDCGTEDGWRFASDERRPDTIELCGSACLDLRTAGQLETEYACAPEG